MTRDTDTDVDPGDNVDEVAQSLYNHVLKHMSDEGIEHAAQLQSRADNVSLLLNGIPLTDVIVVVAGMLASIVTAETQRYEAEAEQLMPIAALQQGILYGISQLAMQVYQQTKGMTAEDHVRVSKMVTAMNAKECH